MPLPTPAQKLLASPWFKYVAFAVSLLAHAGALATMLAADGHPQASTIVLWIVALCGHVSQYLAASGLASVTVAATLHVVGGAEKVARMNEAATLRTGIRPPPLAALAIVAFAGLFLACSSVAQAGANFIKIESAICLADEAAASIIPPSAVQLAAADIALVCTDVPVASIVAFLEGLLAGQADAGAPAATVYKPSPHVMAAHAAKVAAFGGAK